MHMARRQYIVLTGNTVQHCASKQGWQSCRAFVNKQVLEHIGASCIGGLRMAACKVLRISKHTCTHQMAADGSRGPATITTILLLTPGRHQCMQSKQSCVRLVEKVTTKNKTRRNMQQVGTNKHGSAPTELQLMVLSINIEEWVIRGDRRVPGVGECMHDQEVCQQLPKPSHSLLLGHTQQSNPVLLPLLVQLLLLLLPALLH
jgi:hypothetical protein